MVAGTASSDEPSPAISAPQSVQPVEQKADARARRRRARRQAQVPQVPASVEAMRDIPYADTDNPCQRLDLYLPKARTSDKPLPVVVFIHGGGWQSGDKNRGLQFIAPLVESGDYVGVSVGYRLSGEAIWPAQIHDCKAAIRWVRANAAKYRIDSDRIGVMGTSAGGHLVALLGTTGDVQELEGSLGAHLDQDSRVACVVDLFGPTDLFELGSQNKLNSSIAKLIGGTVSEHEAQAREASPTSYVSRDDAPFMMIHGTADKLVPIRQSELLQDGLQKAGVATTLIPVEGGPHGANGGADGTERRRQFFDKHLRGKEVTISDEPMQQAPATKAE